MVEDTVDGVPLSVILEQGALPQSAAVGLVRRVFRALHIYWNQRIPPTSSGLIHGDLDPGNMGGARFQGKGVGAGHCIG